VPAVFASMNPPAVRSDVTTNELTTVYVKVDNRTLGRCPRCGSEGLPRRVRVERPDMPGRAYSWLPLAAVPAFQTVRRVRSLTLDLRLAPWRLALARRPPQCATHTKPSRSRWLRTAALLSWSLASRFTSDRSAAESAAAGAAEPAAGERCASEGQEPQGLGPESLPAAQPAAIPPSVAAGGSESDGGHPSRLTPGQEAAGAPIRPTFTLSVSTHDAPASPVPWRRPSRWRPISTRTILRGARCLVPGADRLGIRLPLWRPSFCRVGLRTRATR